MLSSRCFSCNCQHSITHHCKCLNPNNAAHRSDLCWQLDNRAALQQMMIQTVVKFPTGSESLWKKNSCPPSGQQRNLSGRWSSTVPSQLHQLFNPILHSGWVYPCISLSLIISQTLPQHDFKYKGCNGAVRTEGAENPSRTSQEAERGGKFIPE